MTERGDKQGEQGEGCHDPDALSVFFEKVQKRIFHFAFIIHIINLPTPSLSSHILLVLQLHLVQPIAGAHWRLP